MNYKGNEIKRLGHDAFKLVTGGVTVYFDPFNLPPGNYQPANFILISHHHSDHCSLDDIKKLISDQTVILAAGLCSDNLQELVGSLKEIIYVEPGQIFEFNKFKVETVLAYNLNKWRSEKVFYHPKEEKHVGYLVSHNEVTFYHAGDSDHIPEMAKLMGKVDVALLPVSGTYVMTWQEAVAAAKVIMPKLAIPMHYDSIVGTKDDAEKFKDELIGSEIEVRII